MSAAANEMIAVLMTDLEGSTAMAERLGPAAAEELRLELFALLRGALERNGGREVKSLGDGLMVVFDGAAQSLACAVQMQQAVKAHNRRAEEKLAVRVGVSLGDATVEGGDYYGKPVGEAARLCAHATGGQIVITDLLYRVAGSRDGHAFEPLGGLVLNGISEPVQAFELRWRLSPITGMALPERLRELPATAFVGREAERERMAELWGDACGGSRRVALLSGEPGIGKNACRSILLWRSTERARPSCMAVVMKISGSTTSRGCRRSRIWSRRHRGPSSINTSSASVATLRGSYRPCASACPICPHRVRAIQRPSAT